MLILTLKRLKPKNSTLRSPEQNRNVPLQIVPLRIIFSPIDHIITLGIIRNSDQIAQLILESQNQGG